MQDINKECAYAEVKLKKLQAEKADLKKIVNTLKISIQVILQRLSFDKNSNEDEKENKIIQNN